MTHLARILLSHVPPPHGARAAAALRDMVWEEAAVAPALDPAVWRIDHHCRMLRYDDFNDESSIYGWGIAPVACDDDDGSQGATDVLGAVNFSSLKADFVATF